MVRRAPPRSARSCSGSPSLRASSLCAVLKAAERDETVLATLGFIGTNELKHHAKNIIRLESVRCARPARRRYFFLASAHAALCVAQALVVPRERLERRVAVLGKAADAMTEKVNKMEADTLRALA